MLQKIRPNLWFDGQAEEAAAFYISVFKTGRIVNTLRYTDISASASIRFSVVLWGLLSGVSVFGERPDGLAMAGIVLIVGSGIYTLHREAKLKRLRKAHTTP